MKRIIHLANFIVAFNTFSQINNTLLLDNNNAAGIIGDEGIFFTNNSETVPGYEIPKGGGVSTIYAGSYWIGAEDINGTFHFSCARYAQNGLNSEIHSGPIANPYEYSSLAYSNQYLESIWRVTNIEIENHILNYANQTYTAPQSILTWPGNGDMALGVSSQLAPYIDVNSDGIYEPSEGDYPDIRGDEAVYVIMNDESSQELNALGIELHVMFYQYSNGNYINNTTFMNMKVYNRSNTDYFNYKQSLFLDFDIGNFSDDYIGCNIPNSVAFAYNADNVDENDAGNLGYGINPPCQGVVSLSHDMNSFGYFTQSSSGIYNDYLSSDTILWNFMNAQWGDNSPWLYGGLGYSGSAGVTNSPTNFLFSGNPNDANAWHEGSNNNSSGDRRVVMTIAEDNLLAGSSVCSDYAFIYDKSSTRLGNVQNVINIAGSLRILYNSQDGFPCQSGDLNVLSEDGLMEFTLYPNPSKGEFTIEFENVFQDANVSIIDMAGRELKTQVINEQKTVFQLNQGSGVYFVKIQTDEGIIVEKMIIE